MVKSLINNAKKENIILEVKQNKSSGALINITNGIKEKYEVSNTNFYNIKALIDNKTVNIRTSKIDDVQGIINEIKSTASLIEEKTENTLAKDIDINRVSSKKIEVDLKKVLEELLSLEKLKDKYKEISHLEIDFAYDYNEISIINETASLYDNNLIFSYGASIVVKKEDKTQSVYFNKVSKEHNFEELKEDLIKKIEDVINKIDAESIESSKYNIVLKNEAAFSILRNITSLFNAEKINKNLSCLSGKFNKQIFSDKITIIEDPSNDLYPGKRLFDDEGTKTYYKEIVKNGKFITKLYDNKEALKDKTVSTGNSFGVRNIYIKPGEKSFEDLVKACKNGAIIDRVEGLHSGLNTLTGEFSLQAQGYKIKDGKINEALNLIILTSNIFELFGNVKEVGNDLKFKSLVGASPSLLIENISISGSKGEIK